MASIPLSQSLLPSLTLSSLKLLFYYYELIGKELFFEFFFSWKTTTVMVPLGIRSNPTDKELIYYPWIKNNGWVLLLSDAIIKYNVYAYNLDQVLHFSPFFYWFLYRHSYCSLFLIDFFMPSSSLSIYMHLLHIQFVVLFFFFLSFRFLHRCATFDSHIRKSKIV